MAILALILLVVLWILLRAHLRLETIERRLRGLEARLAERPPAAAVTPMEIGPIAPEARESLSLPASPARPASPIPPQESGTSDAQVRAGPLPTWPEPSQATLPAALTLPAERRITLPPVLWQGLERTLIANWTGILGVVVLVAGVTFVAVNLGLRLGPLVRFLLTLAVAGGLILPSLLWGTRRRWRWLTLWLRSGGAALILFACFAAGAQPELGLRWLDDPLAALLLLLGGMGVNLTIALRTSQQGVASLHVLLNLVPLLVSPQGGLTLAIAAADGLAGQLLPWRRDWDRHRLLVPLGYGLFQLIWAARATDALGLPPSLRAAAVLAGLVVFGSGIALLQSGAARRRLSPLAAASLFAGWGGLALALLLFPLEAGTRAGGLLLAALAAAGLALRARRHGSPQLHRGQVLASQGLLMAALLSLQPLLPDQLLLTAALLLECALFLLFGLREREPLIQRWGWWLVVLISAALLLQGLLAAEVEAQALNRAILRHAGLLVSAGGLLVALADRQARQGLPLPPLLGWLASALVVVGVSMTPPPAWQPVFALVGGGGLLIAARLWRPPGLASGSLVMLGIAQLSAWHWLLSREHGTAVLLGQLLPLLALAGLSLVTAEVPWRRCLGIDLLGLNLILASQLLPRPLSPLLPGVLALLLALVALELANRLRRLQADHVLALGIAALATFAGHFLLVTSQSPHLVVLGTLAVRGRLVIELFALAVLLHWWFFQPRPALRASRLWQTLQPCFLEFGLLAAATTILSEVDLLWRPLAWSLLALLLLSPWIRRLFAARIQIYAVLIFWLAIAATLAILSTIETPSPLWFEQPGTISTLAILVQVLFLALAQPWLRSEDLADPGGWPLLGWIGALLHRRSHRWLGYPLFAVVALHLADRYDQALLTLLWALEAFVIFGISVGVRDNQFRVVALVGLGLCLIRLLAIDMAQADLGLRGLVFIGVGLLMLAMNALYNRFRERFL